MSEGLLNKSLQKLLDWLDKNGWKGYDPYDIKAAKGIMAISRRAEKSKVAVIIREIVFEFVYTFPVLSRKLFHVKPRINAKAMGLFASSYLKYYKISKEKKHLDKAQECIDWLIANKIEKGEGIGWGYPFAWQSTKYIPEHTPNGIVTTAAGEAFWEFYKHTNEKVYLDYCAKIASFLFSLPSDTFGNGICFSYTPLFTNHVHNLNLFVAEFLIKVGMETNNEHWVSQGNMAVNYTISNQLENGSFDYNGPPEPPQHFIDNYHTGFVLRMLYSIWNMTNRQDVYDSLAKCYDHYKGNFFENGEIPKLMPDRKYRIDIHSCAESIHCLSILSAEFPDAENIASKVKNWTIRNLQDKEGFFYYGIMKSRFTGTPFKSKIAYIRWGQAWMLKALTTYSSTFNQPDKLYA